MFHSQVKLFPLFFCQTSVFVWQFFFFFFFFWRGWGGGPFCQTWLCSFVCCKTYLKKLRSSHDSTQSTGSPCSRHRQTPPRLWFHPLATMFINPFTAMLATHTITWKQPIKVPNLKPLRLFCPLHISTRKDFYSTIGLSDILFGGVISIAL